MQIEFRAWPAAIANRRAPEEHSPVLHNLIVLEKWVSDLPATSVARNLQRRRLLQQRRIRIGGVHHHEPACGLAASRIVNGIGMPFLRRESGHDRAARNCTHRFRAGVLQCG
ncbi:hypothetical protein LJR084_006929 [Variovorax sp. LjRoot84]|uniref:hypothetical protein n=1 Tax=Variovorax sp. LjRoot84 TaxID=3342340 RepID=UPI003ECE6FEF